MNAIEFVKVRGIERARELFHECPDSMMFIGKCGFSKIGWCGFVYKLDLKQIIDAFELVESYGGLKKAKVYASYIADISWTIHVKLQQAINLVEQSHD